MKSKIFSNKAFTLIELLVVVLIIGILAAIAVPKYQKVVLKSRTSEAVLMIKAMLEAQERFYLATGDHTNNLDELDINIPKDRYRSENIEDMDPNVYYFSCAAKSQCDAGALSPNLPAIEAKLLHTNHNGGKIWCIAGEDERLGKTKLAIEICKSLGRVDPNGWIEGSYFIIN